MLIRRIAETLVADAEGIRRAAHFEIIAQSSFFVRPRKYAPLNSREGAYEAARLRHCESPHDIYSSRGPITHPHNYCYFLGLFSLILNYYTR